MSDITFGQLITDKQGRDAVHIAIAPVVAAETLEPGQHIGFVDDGKVGNCKEPIGIVDPFLKQDVLPGETFWLFLYQKTVKNLRHDWSHPAFENKAAKDREESIAWLTVFAREGELTYEELLAEATECINDSDAYISLGTDTPSRWYEQAATFWGHIEIVTGLKVPDKTATPFSCAC